MTLVIHAGMERMMKGIHTIHGTNGIFTYMETHKNQRFSCRFSMQNSPIGMVWVLILHQIWEPKNTVTRDV